MSNSSIVKILVAVIILLIFESPLTNSAVVRRSPQTDNTAELSDPNKRHVDKEKLKIYRIVAEHIGPSDSSAKASNDTPKYDAVEFEEKKIKQVQEVATSSLDAKYRRSNANVLYQNSDQEDDDELNSDYDVVEVEQQDAKGFHGFPNQVRMSTNVYKQEFTKGYMPTEAYKEYYNQNYIPTKVYKGSDNQDHVLTNAFNERDNNKRTLASYYDKEMVNNGVISTTYNSRAPGELKKFLKMRGNGFGTLRKPVSKPEPADSNNFFGTEKVGNNSNVRIINNTGGQTIIEGPLEIDIKTDPSTGKVNFRFQPGQGPNASLKIERKSLIFPQSGYKKGKFAFSDNPTNALLAKDGSKDSERSMQADNDNQTLMLSFSHNKVLEKDNVLGVSKPLLKLVDNPYDLVPWKPNHMPRDNSFVFIEKPFKEADNGNGVFYAVDETRHPENPDSYFVQALRSNSIAFSFITILVIIIAVLLLYAICSFGKRPQSYSYSKVEGFEHPGDEPRVSAIKRLWHYEFLKGPFAGCRGKNSNVDKFSPNNKDLEEGQDRGKDKTMNVADQNGKKQDKGFQKHNTWRNHEEDDDGKELLRFFDRSKKKMNSKPLGKPYDNDIEDEYDLEYSAENMRAFDISESTNPKTYFNFHAEQPTQENRAILNIVKWIQQTVPGFSKDVEVINDGSKFGMPNESGEPHDALKMIPPEVSEVSVFSAPPQEILKDKRKSPRNTRNVVADSETDFDQPSREKPSRRVSKQRRRSATKKSKFQTPRCDLESVISYEADLSTDDTSFGPTLKPDSENLKMKMVTTGEIKEIDDMLVGNNWNRRVYGAHPFKTTVGKGVTFSAIEDSVSKTREDSSPLSAITKESTRSLENEVGKSLHKAENVIKRGKPLSKKDFNMTQY